MAVKTLKAKAAAYIESCKKSGVRVLDFRCPYCEAKQQTTAPSDNQKWSTVCICTDCTGMGFKTVTRNSVTVARI